VAQSKAQDLARGLSTGAHFLDLLMKEIEKQGGDPALIQLLTKPRFASNLAEVAKTVATLDFRIPASELRSRTERWYRQSFEVEGRFVERFRNLFWYAVLRELGISFLEYSDDEGDEKPVVPTWHRKKLAGRNMEFPLFLDEEYVVVDISFTKSEVPDVGEAIPSEDICILCLAERRFFDFDT
jgi:hypothetical protein